MLTWQIKLKVIREGPRQPPPDTYSWRFSPAPTQHMSYPCSLKGLRGLAPYGSNPLEGTFRPIYVNADVINASVCYSFKQFLN